MTISAVGDMADRKAELEKKRRKLEELKKAREQNKLQAKDKEVWSLDLQLARAYSSSAFPTGDHNRVVMHCRPWRLICGAVAPTDTGLVWVGP